ncbi:uncharacterized protein DDB_G0283697-like [Mercenaria mercenaria]|uniref:uncharacterized protein DDB_G0283697-like n=1 Tax=Mercenaria mercenaria TaxID=6596 RepID=UPI00234ED153|nr:uncharacterized protein DDB_G0283697-like [Mercenaria mercenaria]
MAGKEVQEYVECTMGSQRITRVATPSTGARKRHMSAPGSGELSAKKLKSLNLEPLQSLDFESDRRTVSAKRKVNRRLYSKESNSSEDSDDDDSQFVVTSAEVHVNASTSVEQLISKLSIDMHKMYENLHSRIEALESGLEDKIVHRISNVFDKRFRTEVNKLEKKVDDKIDAKFDTFKEEIKGEIKAEVNSELGKLNNKIEQFSQQTGSEVSRDFDRSVAILNLPESRGENIETKVNALVREGLKIRDIRISSVSRKRAANKDSDGVVIVKFSSREDKQKVMSAKKSLRDSRQYAQVYINHDQPKSERVFANNFRKILSAMRTGDSNLEMRGTHVVNRRDSSGRRDNDNGRDNRDRRGDSRGNHGDDNSRRNDYRDRDSEWSSAGRHRNSRGSGRGGPGRGYNSRR